MENQLTAMEARIEELLAQAEKDQADVERVKDQKDGSGAGDQPGSSS